MLEMENKLDEGGSLCGKTVPKKQLYTSAKEPATIGDT
jgi:hypothetical protein